MQVRLGNRQDEGAVRELIGAVLAERGAKLDLSSSDADLRNIEAGFVGAGGVFLLAEDEGTIVGVAGALAQDETCLCLKRFCVAKPSRRQGLAKKLLAVLVEFARDMEYSRIFVPPGSCQPDSSKAMLKLGFRQADGGWAREIEPAYPVPSGARQSFLD